MNMLQPTTELPFSKTEMNVIFRQTDKIDGFMRLVGPAEYRCRDSMADAARFILQKHPKATLHLIRSELRNQWLVRIRIEMILHFRDKLGKTYPQIAKFMRRDHTSILHLYRKGVKIEEGMGAK